NKEIFKNNHMHAIKLARECIFTHSHKPQGIRPLHTASLPAFLPRPSLPLPNSLHLPYSIPVLQPPFHTPSNNSLNNKSSLPLRPPPFQTPSTAPDLPHDSSHPSRFPPPILAKLSHAYLNLRITDIPSYKEERWKLRGGKRKKGRGR
ncbi:hypothetical protein SK128_002066, partial [Halocaridina rubra]